MEAAFIDEQAVQDAIHDVRAGKDGINWMAVTYESGKSQKLKLLGKGTGGADELREKLNDDLVVYGIVRVADRVDESDTVKFCWVFFLGESVGRMQRARTSTHQNAVRRFIGQTHVDISITTREEISAEVVQSKVMITSGTQSRVLDASGSKSPRPANSPSTTTTTTTNKKEEASLSIKEEEKLKSAIAAVRSDSDPTTWAVLNYDGSDLTLVGTGAGTVDQEVVPLLKDDNVMFALIRKQETIDESVTVKFVFVSWTGNNVKAMIRARLSAHTAQIDNLFHPYHTSIHCDRQGEVSDDIIINAISKASGTASNVRATVKPVESRPQWTKRTSTSPNTPNQSSSPATTTPTEQNKDGLPFVNETECRDALKEVRDDANPTEWAAIGIPKGGKTVQLLGKGVGFNEMLKQFNDDSVIWVLLRRTLIVDESQTIKFVHINWTGENIARMLRARLIPWSGAVQSLFSPYHVDIKANNLNEITEEIVVNAVETAAGRKDHVLS